MKRKLYILLAILLLAGMTASAQMKRGGQKKEVPKTEKTTSKKQKKQSGNSGKSNSSGKGGTQQEPRTTTVPDVVKHVMDDMVWVEGGTFTMGATSEQGSDAYNNEKPTHQVTLSGYYIGKYEVTQELWQTVMGTNPSKYTGNSRSPVECVSWDDCQQFLRKLNQMSGHNFRLPTEAEWEFAARGGNQSCGYKYAGSNTLFMVSWSEHNYMNTTQPVGQYTPNELGLYDMSGNVWEWCQDWYGDYSSGSQTNPTGPSSGSYRVYRGGSWSSNARFCRVSNRNSNDPSHRYDYLGLRLAL